MRNRLVALLSISFILFAFVYTLEAKNKEVEIKTSAKCGMCKMKIEKNLNQSTGINEANLDVKSKIVKVNYDDQKTSEKKIKEIISDTGYDAGEVKADKKAYEELHGCCK